VKKIFLLVFISSFALAQNKPAAKSPPAGKPGESVKKTDEKDQQGEAVQDTIDPRETEAKSAEKFAVFTKRAMYSRDKKMRLCISLAGYGKTVNYCVVDSFCKDPENARILFERLEADTTYLLVYVDAVTKQPDKAACDAGHETKLVFLKWNIMRNKVNGKGRVISSCMRAITNMTKFPIADWDGSSPLVVEYHKGQMNFVEARFDPENFKAGIQSAHNE
jgi:hypothetical protein